MWGFITAVSLLDSHTYVNYFKVLKPKYFINSTATKFFISSPAMSYHVGKPSKTTGPTSSHLIV